MPSKSTNSKIQKIITDYGHPPLSETPIPQPLTANPETLLAMVLDALLKSRPISHNLSQKAVSKLIEVGYHDIKKLRASSWEERAMVLKEGGYNRYREQGATNLGDLAILVEEKYDGDLNNLLHQAHHNRQTVHTLLKEIKGLGDLGIEIFLNNAQSVWPSMAPFIDTRSLGTAEEVGIGVDAEGLFRELGGDEVKMCRLANGLSVLRLEGRVLDVE